MKDIYPISEEILAIRRLLASWLASPESQPTELLDWLQGYNLPVSESGEEPYLWILRGLPLTSERSEARHRLAQRVALVLKEQPDIHPTGRRPEQVLYNLLMLAAGLAWPAELADPLYEIYKRSVLSGSYPGLDLRSALRSAMSENQLDNRLEREWFAMLQGNREARLPGNPFQAYYGLLLMPVSPATLGQPNLNALGKALKLITDYLEKRTNRWLEFEGLRDKIKIFGEPLPYEQLILKSQEYRWPAWAVLNLISLAAVGDARTSEITGFVWSPLIGEIPQEYSYQILCTYHEGNIEKIQAPEQTWKFLLELGDSVRPDITKAPYSFSFDAFRAAFNHLGICQFAATG